MTCVINMVAAYIWPKPFLLLALHKPGHITLNVMPRACNVSPVPHYCEEGLEASFKKHIDGEPDDKILFELHTYDKKHKSAPAALACMAKLRSLITWILVVARAARVNKLALKRCIGGAIDD